MSVLPSVKTMLLAALAATAVAYAAVLLAAIRRARRAPGANDGPTAVTVPGAATGFVANFFDTLGVGSFATTTTIFRHWRLVRDEWIPGTLNAGHTVPTIAQALIYTQIVPVGSRTLIAMIGAAITGAWLGAGLVSRLPRRAIQLGMGIALLAAAALMLGAQFQLLPAGGEALELTGGRLALAVGGNFALGALMTLGIGLYAPCMILVSLLGMNPTAAFPIMMGSCAFLMPVASARFIQARSYHPGMALSMLLGGIPAVLVAAFIVRSLPLTAVRYLVVIVVVYTAVNLVRAAIRERGAPEPAPVATREPGTVVP
jgi:uncharacterized membrane protein YfcA